MKDIYTRSRRIENASGAKKVITAYCLPLRNRFMQELERFYDWQTRLRTFSGKICI